MKPHAAAPSPPASLSFPPDDASSWRRIRRYAVPRRMIEEATERRQAGDWQGACAAALADVDVDLAGIARRRGAAVADMVEDDLRHLAPDLLRWHLPRILHGRTTLATDRVIMLSDYGTVPARPPGPGGRRGRSDQGGGSVDTVRTLALCVKTTRLVDGPQRMTVTVARISGGPGHDRRLQDWTCLRHLWDARRVGELRERCGGGVRAPFFRPDGTPLPPAEPGDVPPNLADPASAYERLTWLWDRGEIEAAFAAAGIDLVVEKRSGRGRPNPPAEHGLARLPLAPGRLAAEAGWLMARHGDVALRVSRDWPHPDLLFDFPDGGRLRVRTTTEHGHEPEIAFPEACWRRLPDLDLLRYGLTTPAELHPLVRTALFPELTLDDAPGRPDPAPPEPVRVRCRGEWHEVRSGGGELRVPHSDEEVRREEALRAFGGAVAGCFAVRQAWTDGTGRLPRALREQRRELFSRVQHGDVHGVLRLLDAGVDPRIRDGRRRTLLHQLSLLDHRPLLPRLLEAGVDLEARDQGGRTPLHVAVGDGGSAALVRELLDAGAKIDIVDDSGWSLLNMIKRYRQRDLGFLAERLERECLDLGDWDFVLEQRDDGLLEPDDDDDRRSRRGRGRGDGHGHGHGEEGDGK